MSRRSSECVVLLTGFAPFGEMVRNPSADVVRRLARDASLRRLGLRTAVLPVHRRDAPRRLEGLLERHRPRILLLTGVAAGRPDVSVERVAVNCWRRPADRGEGKRIAASGPDGLFATLPLERSVACFRSAGIEANVSETAGTFACNLVLYHALRRARLASNAASLIGFIHLPATRESLPPGDGRPTIELEALVAGMHALIRDLAGGCSGTRQARLAET